MRHVIIVVGCEEQRREAVPVIRLLHDESLREMSWYACADQAAPTNLLDDTKSLVLRLVRAPVLAYRFYLLANNTKLWSGKRPLILIRSRGLASRLAAYAGTCGGGDVVMPYRDDEVPLGPTRYLLQPDGKLELRTD